MEGGRNNRVNNKAFFRKKIIKNTIKLNCLWCVSLMEVIRPNLHVFAFS